MGKKTYQIQEIGEVVGGGTPSTKIAAYWDGDIAWISPVDLSHYNNVYIEKGKNNITQLGLKKSSTVLLPPNTVLLTSRAPIGYMALAKNSICTNQGFKSIICNPKFVNYRYLYYYLRQSMDYIKLFASGSTFPELSGTRLKRIKITIKITIEQDVTVQKKIASILSVYDDLIENNNKRIKILEQMAENLYKEWFVRFRFPGYETAEFENGIPKDWKYVKLGKILSFVRGISYSSEEIDCNDGLNLLNLKNIQSYGGFRRDGTKKYNGKYKAQQVVKKGDLIMGVTDMTQDRRTVGSVALVPHIGGTSIISADLVKVNSDVDKRFLYCMCRYGFYSAYFSQFANGVNVLHLRSDTLLNKKLLLPDEKVIGKFIEILSPIIQMIDELNIAKDYAKTQRDLLLPRLMSGKLEV